MDVMTSDPQAVSLVFLLSVSRSLCLGNAGSDNVISLCETLTEARAELKLRVFIGVHCFNIRQPAAITPVNLQT